MHSWRTQVAHSIPQETSSRLNELERDCRRASKSSVVLIAMRKRVSRLALRMRHVPRPLPDLTLKTETVKAPTRTHTTPPPSNPRDTSELKVSYLLSCQSETSWIVLCRGSGFESWFKPGWRLRYISFHPGPLGGERAVTPPPKHEYQYLQLAVENGSLARH